MEEIQGATSGESSKRMSSPPTFEQQRMLQRASLPPRPNGSARHSKRLTLNFPINIPPPALSGSPSEQNSPSPGMMTPATATQSSGYSSPNLLSSAVPAPSNAGEDSSDFLVALAAQERKVLELREELHRAEADLVTLKRQWALNERGRKHTQIKHRAEVMKPLKHPEQDQDVKESNGLGIESADPVLPSQSQKSKELERRASLKKPVTGNAAVSANGRRVFQSSRHTRTLSLLSPDMMGPNFQNSFPQPPELIDGGKPDSEQTLRHPRSATLPSVDRGEESNTIVHARRTNPTYDDEKARWRRSMPMPPPSHDALVRTGKQMASDFKDGLWTFLEDIRQATVGEEGISGTESRTTQPTSTTQRHARTSNGSGSPRGRERPTVGMRHTGSSASRVNQNNKHGKTSTPTDTEVSFWNEFGVDTPGQTTAASTTARPAKKDTPNGSKDPDDSTLHDVVDNWDTWDTPVKSHTPSSSRSTFVSKRDHSPSSDVSSPRTSTRCVFFRCNGFATFDATLVAYPM